MILYHGTLDRYAFDIWQNGINLNKSKPLLDFGMGFYTTPEKELAIDTAIKRSNRNNEFKNNPYAKPYLVRIKIDEAIFDDYRVKIFDTVNDEWANFIINNRCEKSFLDKNKIINHNHNIEYDIVIGPTADGIVTNIAYEVMNGLYTIENDVYKKFLTKDGKDYGKQISFHSNKIVYCIKVLDCAIIKL
jgi:hypothetical protein